MNDQWWAEKNRESGAIERVGRDELLVNPDRLVIKYKESDGFDQYICEVVPVRIVEDGEPCEWESFEAYDPIHDESTENFVWCSIHGFNFCPMCGRKLEE